MKKEFRRVSSGEYCLTETEERNVYIFYRKDEKPFNGNLQKVIDEAIRFYKAYMQRYVIGYAKQSIAVAISDNKQFIKLIVTDMDKRTLH